MHNKILHKLPENDLSDIVQSNISLWHDMRDQCLFITGGTGFFGQWLLESLAWANKELNLNISAIILTRSVKKVQNELPHLYQNSLLDFYEGDIRDFEFPKKEFSYIIHAAVDMTLGVKPGILFDNILAGTRHILEFAKTLKSLKSFLFISSGAVYGDRSNLLNLAEDLPFFTIKNKGYKSEYGPAKQQSEIMCQKYANKFNLNIKIARCFSFIGPGIPLDSHFSVSGFIASALQKEPIIIRGDGTPRRSWLYASDLTKWLWTILLKGKSMYPYNVGSEEVFTIAELAYQIANIYSPPLKVVIELLNQKKLIDSYIPNTQRAKIELNLISSKKLYESICSTLDWYKK